MDYRRAIYHSLKWHSTVLSVTDFEFVGTDRKIQFFDADRTSTYDAIDNLMRGALAGQLVSDRQGKLWAEVEARAYDNPTGSFSPPIMEITARDWINAPQVDEYISDQMSYMEVGGVAYSGSSTGTFAALLAAAPGSAPTNRGRIESIDGLALGGQSHLNTLSGNLFANENVKEKTAEIDFAGKYTNIDIAPQQSLLLDVPSSDTVRGKRINGLFIPQSVSFKYDPKSTHILTVRWIYYQYIIFYPILFYQ